MGFETEADMSEHLWGATCGEELKRSALQLQYYLQKVVLWRVVPRLRNELIKHGVLLLMAKR